MGCKTCDAPGETLYTPLRFYSQHAQTQAQCSREEEIQWGGGELVTVLEISALDHYLMRSDSPLWKPNIDNIDDNIGATIDDNIEDKKAVNRTTLELVAVS